jgi:hypothetical protein
MTDDDRDLMNGTVEAICEAVCHTLDRAWRLSPTATLIALSRVLAFLAFERVQSHPDERDRILAALEDIATCVEVETGVTH